MANLLPQTEFLEKYRIPTEVFDATNLAWADLEAIHVHYTSLLSDLESAAETISNYLMKVERVHSVRYRTKDAEHLIEKIIRKRKEKPDRVIDIDNYLTQVTDLIGLRAIHLFKEDWLSIHRAVTNKWDLKDDDEDSRAYIREGDNEAHQIAFREAGLAVKTHPRGYRSIHYVAKTKPAKTEFYAEIQVRTIFEEGWSEIDHNVMYPYELENPLYSAFSSILNRLAGSADEMGSFITLLRAEVTARGGEMLEKQKEVERLQALLDKPEINQADKEDLKKSLDDIVTVHIPFARLADVLKTRSLFDMSFPNATPSLGNLAKYSIATGLGTSAAHKTALAAHTSALSRINSSLLSGISNLQPATSKPSLKVPKATPKPSADPEPPQQTEQDSDGTIY